MRRTVRMQQRLAVGVLFLFLAVPVLCTGAGWRTEFDQACAKTDEAMLLTPEELKDLIAKCERVRKALDAEEETVRKVYLKRVQMCQNLFQYVLETKVPKAK